MFALYGFVMNTAPQRSLRVAFQKSLFTWWGLFIFFFFAKRFDGVQSPYMHCLVRWWPPRNHDLFELQIWRTWWLISWGFLCEVWLLSLLCLDCMVWRRTPYQWWSTWWEPSACLVCNVASHRRLVAQQVPVLDIATFVLSSQVMNTVPPWSLRDALAQEVGCHEYCCNWVVWSRDTYPQPWHLIDVDPRSLGCHDCRCLVLFVAA